MQLAGIQLGQVHRALQGLPVLVPQHGAPDPIRFPRSLQRWHHVTRSGQQIAVVQQRKAHIQRFVLTKRLAQFDTSVL
jgi:hypothetical protein